VRERERRGGEIAHLAMNKLESTQKILFHVKLVLFPYSTRVKGLGNKARKCDHKKKNKAGYTA